MAKNDPPDQNAVIRLLRSDLEEIRQHLEKENDRLQKEIMRLEDENKRLRELLKEVISGHEYSWEWKHPSMDWVEVQVSKRTLVDIDKALKGGGG